MVNDNIKDINKLNFDISVGECFTELKPHPKFKDCTFDNYKHDERYPSQLELKNTLRNIKPRVQNERKRFGLFAKKQKRTKVCENIYIDGTYGIGKTHLLSACFHNFDGTKAFLSFMELTYFMNFYGLDNTIELFKNVDLLLIDEFDLDDPATTRMTARFIDAINDGTAIITTSNRLPKELGGGKFDTEQFARELGVISGTFRQMTVKGESFRLNLAAWQANFSAEAFIDTYDTYTPSRGKMIIKYDDLVKQLGDIHPFRFIVIPKNIDALFIDGFKGFKNLNDALRFTVLVDHCYYYDTRLFCLPSETGEIFTKEITETTFERQFLRCKSRLDELAVFFKN